MDVLVVEKWTGGGEIEGVGMEKKGRDRSIKSVGAAAARNGQYKRRRRCRNEKWAV